MTAVEPQAAEEPDPVEVVRHRSRPVRRTVRGGEPWTLAGPAVATRRGIMTKDYSDPMHIYNVRARLAATEAERDMYRNIDQEFDPTARNTPVGMLLRALRDQPQPAEQREN